MLMRTIYGVFSLTVASIFTYFVGWLFMRSVLPDVDLSSWGWLARYATVSFTGFVVFGVFIYSTFELVQWLRRKCGPN